MFIAYALFYAGFVAINLISPALMEKVVFMGLNLAVVYGFSLIIVALIMALIYSRACRTERKLPERRGCRREDRMNVLSVVLFVTIVASVLALSFYFARKAKSASGYYAAGGKIHWSINGIAFAGDYLSAASFLGICGMIATAGYDGFLYSIGYLAGWIVALFIVAEPLKRLGKYTFTDALDANYNHRGIKLLAAISTLVVSLCYLIPQMVGAGVLVTPLLGLPHYIGVIMVGLIVITIVATAGMTSTTYVQFIKGAMLIVFSTVVVIVVLVPGIVDRPRPGRQGTVPGKPKNRRDGTEGRLDSGRRNISSSSGWPKPNRCASPSSARTAGKPGGMIVPGGQEGSVVLRKHNPSSSRATGSQYHQRRSGFQRQQLGSSRPSGRHRRQNGAGSQDRERGSV